METSKTLLSQIRDAAKQVTTKSGIYVQLMEGTFRKSAKILDELLDSDYSLVSYVKPDDNPFTAANMVKRKTEADCTGKVRHVYWNKGNRIVLGFCPHNQGSQFQAIWLSMHPVHSGIRVYFGSDDNTVDLPESAWDADHAEGSLKALTALLHRGLVELVAYISSVEVITSAAYRYFEAQGSIQLRDVDEHSESPSLKPKNPIGFTRLS